MFKKIKEARDTIIGTSIVFASIFLAAIFHIACCIYYKRNCDRCGNLCEIK